MMHRPDRHAPWNELWDAFDCAKYQGKLTYVGASNFNAYDLARAEWAADLRNRLGLACTEARYNLLYRGCEGDFLPALQEMGIGLITWGPLAEGYLAGKYTKTAGTRKSLVEQIDQKNIDRLVQYGELCKRIGHTEADVSLAWLLQQPAVTCPLIGPRTMEHLTKSLDALDIRLEQPELDAIDALFPKGEPYIEGPLSWKEIR